MKMYASTSLWSLLCINSALVPRPKAILSEFMSLSLSPKHSGIPFNGHTNFLKITMRLLTNYDYTQPYPIISIHINQIDSCRFKTAWTKPPSRSLHRPMSRPSHRSGWRQRPGRSLGRASRPSTDPGPQWNLHRHEGCPNKLRLHRHGWQQMRFRSLGSAERQRVDLALHCYHHLFKHQPAGAGE